MKRTSGTSLVPVAALLVGLTGMLGSGLARAQTQPVTPVGPVASPVISPQTLVLLQELQELAAQQQLRITSAPPVAATVPATPVSVPAAVPVAATVGPVAQPTTVVLTPTATARPAQAAPPPPPNYFTQGAEATGVPAQGPGAQWFTNGAGVLTVPDTLFE